MHKKINKYTELATEIQQMRNVQKNKYPTNGYFGHWNSTPTSQDTAKWISDNTIITSYTEISTSGYVPHC
jgi:hypothetical protein